MLALFSLPIPPRTQLLPSVKTSFEIKMKLQDTSLKSRFVSSSSTNFPFFVDNFKGKVFVRWTRCKTYDAEILRVGGFHNILGRDGIVHEIRVKDVELVPLDCFGGWIVSVVMGTIVFVPIVPWFDFVQILWLSRSVFVSPSRRMFSGLISLWITGTSIECRYYTAATVSRMYWAANYSLIPP